MAGLFLRTERRELNDALGSVGELKNVIAHSVFEARGFTDVANTESEVAGNRPGIRVSVIYLFIGDRNFWRVVSCVADAGFPTAQAAGDEVANAIDQLAFL
jgi:hypothetical protein